MMRGLLTLGTLLSTVLFPWPLTAALALGMASVEPFVPLATGLLADTLYYVPGNGAWPFFTICGAVVTLIASVVQSRLRG